MSDSGTDFGRLRILLAEDEKFALRLEMMAIKHIGINTITVAADGCEAMALLEQNADYDLIFSDWNMPMISGIELLRVVRKRWPHIPFIMLTGNKSVGAVQEAAEVGVDGYIVKPFSPQQLQSKIVAALRRGDS